ncbi:MAG: DUF11 domain-containing protein [bacterium]|nr:MAG: DUF11 domain-containing protein [bacterium]
MVLARRLSGVVSTGSLFFAALALMVSVPGPVLAVTGFTLEAELQSSVVLTGCGTPTLESPGVVSGGTVAAGMICDNTLANNGGSVLVFKEPASGWSGTVFQSQVLYPGNPAADGNFGANVDIDGDTLVVGSQRAGGNILGSVYVFTRSSPAGTWEEAARLNAPEGENSWGWNPKVSGDVVIAGDPNPGVFGTRPGAVWVFVKGDSGWADTQTPTAKLMPANATSAIRFGSATDIAGSVIAVGARSDLGGVGRGYVFVEPSGGWASHPGTEDAILTNSITSSTTLRLGEYRGVVTDGDTVVLRPFSPSHSNTGLYIYEKPGLGWAGTLTETAWKNGVWGDVDLDADTLIVNRAIAAGAYSLPVLLFERPAAGWDDTRTATDSFPHATAGQRVDASLDGGTAVIGQYVYVSSVPTSPVLTVTKGDTPDPVVVNGDLTYTVSVRNDGPGSVTGVTATDTLPAGVDYVNSIPADACTVDSIVGDVTTVVCSLRDLLEDELTSAQLNITAPSVIGTVTNTVSVAANEISAPVTASQDTLVVDAAADLEILLTHGPEPVSAGSVLSYSADVINNGPSDAPAVTVTVGLPSDTTFLDAVARNAVGQTIPGACSEVRESVVCGMGTVGAGDNVEVNVDVTAPNTAGIVTNAADVTSAVADPGPSPNTATDQATVVLPGIDLADSVNAPDDFMLDFGMVDVGSSVAGSITVTNNRASSVDVGLISTLDPPFSIVVPETCSGGALGAGGKCVITIQFDPTAADVNGALVQGLDLNIGSSGASFLITGTAVPTQADLVVSLTRVNNDLPSQNIFRSEYTVSVLNDGPADAEGFYLVLDLPPQAANPMFSFSGTVGGLLVCVGGRCDLPSPLVFPAGETAGIVVEVERTGNLGEASVTVGADTPDPDESNNTSRVDAGGRSSGGGGSICPGLILVDPADKPNWPGGTLMFGLMALLFLVWSRIRRRPVPVRS